MELSARSYALTVSRTAETLGVAMPAGYLDALAQADTLAAKVSAIATVSAGDLHAAVLSALEAGRDYHEDADVRRLLLDRTLASQNLEQTARNRADNQLRSTLTDWSDDMLESWADALEPHAQALADAAKAVPNLHLGDAAGAVARGGDVMHHLHAVQVAVKAWAAAGDGFGALAAVAGIRYSQHTAPLILTPARLADLAPAYETARNERTDTITALNLARNGIPLQLATIADFMARVAIFEVDREAEARAEAKRREKAGFNTR